MAFGSYFPATYQQPYNNYQQMLQQQLYSAPQQQQIQNGGFVVVRSEEEARSYPVAPGHSVTFKNENEQYMYTKTMGFSQLDQPIFEKYRLIKEESQQDAVTASKIAENGLQTQEAILSQYVKKGELEQIFARLEALEAERPKKAAKKAKEEAEND